MDQTGEVSLALDLYADEGSLVDPERKHTLIIRAKNKRIKRELEELFFGNLLWDTNNRPCIRYLCKFGDCPYEIIPDRNRGGVAALKHMNVYNFTRVETRFGDLVGFFFQDDLLPDPVFLHPWQVMHLRLSSLENIFAPYGRAILDGGRKAFKQLRLMEDAALIYRITRAPEKRKFKIPVGLIPAKDIPEYMYSIAREFKRRRFYNPATGTFDERYSPLIQEDDFLLPMRPDGTGPDVDTLPGAENLDQIADIEYFKKKMIAPMKIPFARVGIGEGAGAPNGKSLSQEHSEFAKAVQWVQREVSTGLTKVAIVHLAMRGYSVEDLKGFEIALTASSAIEELYRIETWQTRVQVMADLKDIGWFPKEWIVTHFTDLTPDEIEELKEMEDAAAGGGEGGGKSAELGLGGGPGGPEEPGGEGEALGGAGGEAGGEGGEAGGEGGGDDALGLGKPPAEQYDWQRERRVINELHKQDNRKAIMEIVKRWADRLGKGKVPDRNTEPINHFKYLLESKELDGLSKSAPPQQEQNRNGDGQWHPPKAAAAKPEDILVEWSVDEAERISAIEEIYKILRESVTGQGAGAAADDDEIGLADLPHPQYRG